MSVVRFVDAKVLIYAASPAPHEADKQNAVQRLLEAGDLALSVQVLQEFYHQATRSNRLGAISRDHALRFIESISHFPVQNVTLEVFRAGVAIRRRCVAIGITTTT